MAGTINLALSQQFDMDGVPLSGGLLYFFQAGTSTPQNAFQDTALTIVHPNPLVLDASGRVPMFYVASTEPPNIGQTPNGQIKIRLTDKNGVVVIAADNLLVIGPAGGGGGGGAVDATTVLATGDIKARYGIGSLTGFVRCNGLTIGNGTSGATERANADCQALFEYLWSTGVLGVFSGGTPNRGASATADFAASKNILLPDLRGRTLAGMDDMGSSAANRLTSSFFGVSGTILGNASGAESKTLVTGNLPAHTHSGVTATENQAHNHNGSFSGTTAGANSSLDHYHLTGTNTTAAQGTINPGGFFYTNSGGTTSFASSAGFSLDHTHNVTTSGATGNENQAHNHNFTTDNGTGTGAAFAITQPSMVLTFYIKL